MPLRIPLSGSSLRCDEERLRRNGSNFGLRGVLFSRRLYVPPWLSPLRPRACSSTPTGATPADRPRPHRAARTTRCTGWCSEGSTPVALKPVPTAGQRLGDAGMVRTYRRHRFPGAGTRPRLLRWNWLPLRAANPAPAFMRRPGVSAPQGRPAGPGAVWPYGRMGCLWWARCDHRAGRNAGSAQYHAAALRVPSGCCLLLPPACGCRLRGPSRR